MHPVTGRRWPLAAIHYILAAIHYICTTPRHDPRHDPSPLIWPAPCPSTPLPHLHACSALVRPDPQRGQRLGGDGGGAGHGAQRPACAHTSAAVRGHTAGWVRVCSGRRGVKPGCPPSHARECKGHSPIHQKISPGVRARPTGPPAVAPVAGARSCAVERAVVQAPSGALCGGRGRAACRRRGASTAADPAAAAARGAAPRGPCRAGPEQLRCVCLVVGGGVGL